MISLGVLIWVSIRPLIRLIICVLCGVVITKLDTFPPIAARGAGMVMLNVAYPALMFSKIVPAFNSDNISALGPLVLVALIYQGIGLLSAWIIKQLFWTPHRFRYGLLMAGGWGNVGDLPTAVVMAVTGAAPFNGTEDQNLAVAFISTFVLVSFLTLFSFGGHHLVAMDFMGPEVENDEAREAAKGHRKALFLGCKTQLRRIVASSPKNRTDDSFADREKQDHDEKYSSGPRSSDVEHTGPGHLRQRDTSTPTNGLSVDGDDMTAPVPSGTCTPKHKSISSPSREPVLVTTNETQKAYDPSSLPSSSPNASPVRSRKAIWKARLKSFISGLMSPCSISIIVAFIIALIPPVKALFVDVSTVHIPQAPDGQPPLAFIMDTTTFIGGAAVPLGLICLGSALARLKVPWNQIGSLPLGSITSLALVKTILMPVLGVLIVQGLVHAGVIDSNNKVLIFVCMFYSCLPTATTQVMLTQVYSGTGEVEHLPAYLIPQYAIMVLSMTTLTAFSLHLIFGS